VIKTKQLCHKILANIGTKSAKAFTNLVISLSSDENARSVVELSESPLFHHQYSSIRDAIAGVGKDESEQSQTMETGRAIVLSELDLPADCRVLLQTDASSIVKAHSDCLEDRQYVKTNNNVIRKNQPISIGYSISLVNMSPGAGKWSIPLDIRRVNSEQTASECAVEQMEALITDEPLSKCFIINTLDTGYGSPAYLGAVYGYTHLVNLIRFRHGKKVWLQWSDSVTNDSSRGISKKGAPRIYGEQFYLIGESDKKTYTRKGVSYEVSRTSIFDTPHQDYVELEGQTNKGIDLEIQVWRWNDLLVRSSKGQNMKDKPFDLIASRVKDKKTGELVFQRTMFVVIHGQQKSKITTKEAFEGYRKRYDIEPSIKFAKQKLLLDKYQTPSQQHFDNWLVVVMMSFWLLFFSKDEMEYRPKKWQQYKEVNKKAATKTKAVATIPLTPNQAKQAAQSLFLTLDPTHFLPKTSNKGKGRLKDTKIKPRIRHPVVKKSQGKNKTKIKIEKIE
jgi:hypothetical protein